ncbi:hypothetical protein ACXWOC_11230, partial [Streptococcus pyogenes]
IKPPNEPTKQLPRAVPTSHLQPLYTALQFSPDGNLLAAASGAEILLIQQRSLQSLRLGAPKTLPDRLPLRGHTEGIQA